MTTKSILNKFLRLKRKVHCLKADIFFLKKCKQHKVFPNFIKIKCSIDNNRTSEVIQLSKEKWLNLERKHLHSKLVNIELELYSLHLYITKTLTTPTNYHDNDIDGRSEFNFNDWLNFLTTVNKKVTAHVKKKQLNLNKKLSTLLRRKSRRTTKRPIVQQIPNYVKNLSDVQFTEVELKFLNNGLNFVPMPMKTNFDNTIVDVETAIKYQPESTKSSIRKETKEIIKLSLKRNTTLNKKDDTTTIKTLKEKDVIYTKADKGNSLVIIGKPDYNRRMEETIIEAEFQNLKRNPLPQMIKESKVAITRINEVFKIPKWRLNIPNPVLPRLYGLPKIHKPGGKMRPIVSNINAPIYKIAKWLVSEFNKLKPPESLAIKNSLECVELLKNITLEADDLLVSFDVISLYPNIPLTEALQVVNEWLDICDISDQEAELYSNLTRMCMEQNQFQFREKFYKLTKGTSMGNPLACFVSNIFMGRLETDLRKEGKLPKTWIRYVDDVLTILKRDEIQPILNILNSQYPTIKFTVEIGDKDGLAFLDIKLKPVGNKICINVFRKPTTTERFITNDSYSPQSHKMAAFNSMVHRMCSLPLSTSNFMQELNCIKRIADINGYFKSDIDILVNKHSRNIRNCQLTTFYRNKKEDLKWIKFNFEPQITNKLNTIFKKQKIGLGFTSENKIKNILGNPKDKIPTNNKSGIYELKCGDCNATYIGQTKRNILTRFKEHISHIKYNRPTKSAVAQHALENNHLNFTIEDLKLKKQVREKNKLDAWESLYIRRYKNKNRELMNIDEEPIQSILFNF